jgi:uncharacterized protein YjdB
MKVTAEPSRMASRVKWRSADKTIATVSTSGVVKAKKEGTVKICAYYGKKKTYCTVTVKAEDEDEEL